MRSSVNFLSDEFHGGQLFLAEMMGIASGVDSFACRLSGKLFTGCFATGGYELSA